MQCASCKTAIAGKAEAAIAISVMGDEYIYSYWYCRTCDVYTVESYHDRFLGEDEISVLGPYSRDVGDRCVELVRGCPRPYDKNCDCPSHRALYYGVPRD